MSDDTYNELKRHADSIAHSLTWSGIAEQVFENEYGDDDITRDEDGFWYDADGDERDCINDMHELLSEVLYGPASAS